MVSEYTKREAFKATTLPLRTTSTETLFYHDRDNIYINDLQINKDQFLYAFGGDMSPGKRQNSHSQRKFGNPAPAGLCAFGMACVTLGLINLGASGVKSADILIGACFFSAGIIELCCGIWELILGNTFGATVFFCFFGFWGSFGCILGNAFGIQSLYQTEKELNHALGLFLLPYILFSFMLWMCTLKSTWPFMILFFMIWLFVTLLDIGYFTQNINLTKSGGAFGVVAGLLGLYNAFAGLSNSENSYFTVQPLFMPGASKPKPIDDVEKQE